MIRVLTLALKAYVAPFRDLPGFLTAFWPALIAGVAMALIPGGEAPPATAPAPGAPAPASPPPAAPVDPAVTTPPPDAVTAPAADFALLLSLLAIPVMVLFLLIVANSSYGWQRRMLTGEPPRSFSWGRKGFALYLRNYMLLSLCYFVILGVVAWLALAYPEEVGVIAADGTVAEQAQLLYVLMTATLIFAILCARLAIRLPNCAVKGGIHGVPMLRERSVWQAIELPAMIFLTLWPIPMAGYFLAKLFPGLPAAAVDMLDYAYTPAVFASGLALFYRELMEPASLPPEPGEQAVQ